MKVDVAVRSTIESTSRVKQLGAMFDVPQADATALSWVGDVPIEDPAHPWNVGLIVGPSGSGKTTVQRQLFGVPDPFEWGRKAVIDDFPAQFGISDIADVCSAVGFNTIPAWMRPHAVLSNGEQFRVELARHILEGSVRETPTVVDEFTSVVDRQVAQIASHAVAKYMRKHDRQFVGVSCHYDIIDWLQPDWVLHLPDLRFERRLVQRRPTLAGRIERVPYSTWRLFAPFHYLTADLNRAARCYGLWIDGYTASPVAFLGMLARPHPRIEGLYGISRIVTLPDWQGLGLGPFLMDTLAGVYRAVDRRVNSYPAHPALTRSFSRSPHWKLVKKPGVWSAKVGKTNRTSSTPGLGGRPSATFQWVGPAYADAEHAARIIGCPHVGTTTTTRDVPAALDVRVPALRRMPRGKVFA